MNDDFKGWSYINALFTYFSQLSEASNSNSHIVPKYVFRGISKRYFTESKSIDLLDSIMETESAKANYSTSVIKCCNKAKNDYDALKDRIQKETDRTKIRKRCLYDRLYQGLIDKIKNKHLKLGIRKKNLLGKFEEHELHLDNEVIDLQVNLDFLRSVKSMLTEHIVAPEQVRSGASVRLRDTEKDYSTSADYLAYVRNLIDGFKMINPGFSNFNELEILAEIQHRGGGSCLVDFSNDFLISLWFATNNDFSDLGYMFCYDVNSDALDDDNLSYLSKEKSSYSIDSLLRKTRKSTRYTGEEAHRFWFWRPANINGRIARQDSVFVFGIEKFEVEKHPMILLPIPPMWKDDINRALKVYFGTTAEVVFPDIDGYANANSKLSKLTYPTQYIRTNGLKIENPEYIQKGMSCLLKGDYRLSLDYFQKWISANQAVDYKTSPITCGSTDDPKLFKLLVEVYYSIGFCYQRLGQNLKSKEYFRASFIRCYNILSKSEIDENFDCLNSFQELSNSIELNDKNSFINKLYKIVDDYIECLFETRDYHLICKIVDMLVASIDDTNENSQTMILSTIKDCSIILICLSQSKRYGKKLKCRISGNGATSSQYLYIINLFFNLIQAAYNNPEDVPPCVGQNTLVCKLNEKLMSTLKTKKYTQLSSNIHWNYNRLRIALCDYWEGDFQAQRFFNEIIDGLEDLQNILQVNRPV